MNINDVLKLVNAGFTKEEIGKMIAGNQEQKQEEVKQEQKQEEVKQEQKQENPLATLEQKFDKFMEIMTNSNFLGANQPKPETVDDIIANIINPKNPYDVKEEN